MPGTNESGDQFGWQPGQRRLQRGRVPGPRGLRQRGEGRQLHGQRQLLGLLRIRVGSPHDRNDRTITASNFDHGDGRSYSDAYIGEIMAVGDFNGDGRSDLATSVFGQVDEVAIAYGTPTGLSNKPSLYPESDGLSFGSSLSAGDINGDGCDRPGHRGAAGRWQTRGDAAGSSRV